MSTHLPETPLPMPSALAEQFWHINANGKGDTPNPYAVQLLQTLDAMPLTEDIKVHLASLAYWSVEKERIERRELAKADQHATFLEGHKSMANWILAIIETKRDKHHDINLSDANQVEAYHTCNNLLTEIREELEHA